VAIGLTLPCEHPVELVGKRRPGVGLHGMDWYAPLQQSTSVPDDELRMLAFAWIGIVCVSPALRHSYPKSAASKFKLLNLCKSTQTSKTNPKEGKRGTCKCFGTTVRSKKEKKGSLFGPGGQGEVRRCRDGRFLHLPDLTADFRQCGIVHFPSLVLGKIS
jgi:hypothetical protein